MRQIVLHRSDILSLDQLALVETLGIGANAVRRSALAHGEEALVIGAGPIGLSRLSGFHRTFSFMRQLPVGR
jgi:threonine dehydrogenase-like Zn-dependent dehydrogenase